MEYGLCKIQLKINAHLRRTTDTVIKKIMDYLGNDITDEHEHTHRVTYKQQHYFCIHKNSEIWLKNLPNRHTKLMIICTSLFVRKNVVNLYFTIQNISR